MAIRQNGLPLGDAWVLVPFNCSFLELLPVMYAEVSRLVFVMQSLIEAWNWYRDNSIFRHPEITAQ